MPSKQRRLSSGLPVRVLVVDDSATMRGLITARLKAHSDIEVVGGAGNALEAREAIKSLSPDVITLDVEMPGMDGISFLEKIMTLRPMPVIMVSSQTEAGARATVEALSIGAFDCVAKPRGGGADMFAELPDLVIQAAASRPKRRVAPSASTASSGTLNIDPDGKIIAIGSSTGGVEALGTVLSAFPANCPPTLITQHMPGRFTSSLAARLNGQVAPTICEATDGTLIQPGHVYIAPGTEGHLELVRRAGLRLRIDRGERVNGHRPSVDVLFNSVARICGRDSVGAILTGMGGDGAKGLLAMREAGAFTLGQNEDSCVVYGMPKKALELGAVEREVDLGRIAIELLSRCDRNRAAA